VCTRGCSSGRTAFRHLPSSTGAYALIRHVLPGYTKVCHPQVGVVCRLRTAMGAARGLAYLHGKSEGGKRKGTPIFHRDIKASHPDVASLGRALLQSPCTAK
jgi:serine/threonine protein kinase